MASFLRPLDEFLGRLGRSPFLSARNFQYTCAICGILSSGFFFFAFVAADFLPPIKPYWTAEQTVHHYKTHEKGIQTGAAFMLLGGMFYLPLAAAISAQMRRIPNLHFAVTALQLASGAAGILAFTLPGLMLAATIFRLDRPVEITQALNDLFWITCFMPWPTFMAQNFAFTYAILIDQRPKPLFPKFMAVLNFFGPILLVPGIAVHCTKTGPVAWDGGLTFWMAGITFCGQMVVDSICLFLAVQSEPVGGEIIEDMFPNRNIGNRHVDKSTESRLEGATAL